MSLSESITSSRLYKKLEEDKTLASAISGIRAKAAALASTLIRDASAFTDHTVEHMDALWSVTEKVLTESEIARMTPAEAFLLGAGFYLHDLGMSYAATAEGRESLMKTPEYTGALVSAQGTPEQKHAAALATAIRIHHAHAAEELSVNVIPGTSEFLIEPTTLREQFGAHCGKIAASHHWSIDKVEAELSSQEVVPLAEGRQADLGFVAGVLRLVDYAHINRERAPRFSRKLRPELGEISAVHWDAQQDVDGPLRNTGSQELVYCSAAPLRNVDAWWLYYEFARGLDNEIRQVRRFLGKRSVSSDRLSLVGVRGADSPEEFAKLVRPDGFLPLEVSVKASSITRLVRLLAGESLYGKNLMAPVRELVQNAVDAVSLKRLIAVTDADRAVANLPIKIKLTESPEGVSLAVSDWGVGMSRRVMVEQLLTIASDYWESQFHIDFPVASRTFSPVGRFGIGFLSVFMLGERITVSSQRAGSERYELTIRGLGKRAELRTVPAESTGGTTVTVHLKQEIVKEFQQEFASGMRNYFPHLDIPLSFETATSAVTLPPRWAMALNQLEFRRWVMDTVGRITPERQTFRGAYLSRGAYSGEELTAEEDAKTWPAGVPEFSEPGTRLIASSMGVSILSLKGFALQPLATPGFCGLIDASDVTPDASRSHGLDFDQAPVLAKAKQAIAPLVMQNLSLRGQRGFVGEQLKFVSRCSSQYGLRVLSTSTFPWVQIVERSGDSRFISTDDFRLLIRSRQILFVLCDSGPNSTSKAWLDRSDEHPSCDLAVCANLPELSVPYNSSEQEERGTFEEIVPRHEGAPLCRLLLKTIAEEWSTSSEVLARTDEWIHEHGVAHGWFRRP
jgi:hypothetical protein